MGVGVTLTCQPNAVGVKLPVGSLVWPDAPRFNATFYATTPDSFQTGRGLSFSEARRRWVKEKLERMYASCPFAQHLAHTKQPLYMCEVQFEGSPRQENLSLGQNLSGLPDEVWALKNEGTITAMVRFSVTHSIYGNAQREGNHIRIWPEGLWGDKCPPHSSLTVEVPEDIQIEGVCVTRVRSTFADWTETLSLECRVECISYAPVGADGSWSKQYKAQTAGCWVQRPSIWDHLVG
jgi:hypothetical protein